MSLKLIRLGVPALVLGMLAALFVLSWRNIAIRAGHQRSKVAQIDKLTDTLRFVVEPTPHVVVAADIDGTIKEVTGDTDLIGWEPGDLIGSPIQVLLPLDDREGFENAYADRVSKGSGEILYQFKDQVTVARDGAEVRLDGGAFYDQEAQTIYGILGPAEPPDEKE